MTDLSNSTLQRLLDVAKLADSPHVDLGPLLGLSHPLLAEVDDLHKLAQSEFPGFKLSYEDAFLTAQPSGSLDNPTGVMFSIGVKV